jgi:hypothetical protein
MVAVTACATVIAGMRVSNLAGHSLSRGVLDTPPSRPPTKSGHTDDDAIIGRRVDASIVYCSGRDCYRRVAQRVDVEDRGGC